MLKRIIRRLDTLTIAEDKNSASLFFTIPQDILDNISNFYKVNLVRATVESMRWKIHQRINPRLLRNSQAIHLAVPIDSEDTFYRIQIYGDEYLPNQKIYSKGFFYTSNSITIEGKPIGERI